LQDLGDRGLRVTTLVLSPRHRADDQLLWRAAIKRGWKVERAHGLSSSLPEIDDDIVIYAEAFFAPLIAKQLHCRLVQPDDDWLARLPSRYLRREVRRTTLGDARQIEVPSFIKPPNDKSFPAKVYPNGRLLPAEFDPGMPVLVATPVSWLNEYRCFVLNGRVVTASAYVVDGELAEKSGFASPGEELAEACAFAGQVASDPATETPIAVALDVGIVENSGWAVVEANGAWGSGIYGCDPAAVLDVLQEATIPRVRA
jgi:hypothetical protein